MQGTVFTLDLEDRRSDPRAEARFVATTYAVLDFLSARGVIGTVFVVGSLAEQYPDLVRDVAARGHEVALHCQEHVALSELGERGTVEDLRRGKGVVEDITGAAVSGYRAPYFSLVPGTPWAPDVIRAAGFTYSSSVMPSRNPIAGYPGAPQQPFQWANGLVELPCPVAGIGPARLPYLGGAYLRILPAWLLRVLARTADPKALRWVYSHPYDFDPGEPFHVMPGTTALQSRLLWYNRRRMFDRVAQVLDGSGALLPLAVPLVGDPSVRVFSPTPA